MFQKYQNLKSDFRWLYQGFVTTGHQLFLTSKSTIKKKKSKVMSLINVFQNRTKLVSNCSGCVEVWWESWWYIYHSFGGKNNNNLTFWYQLWMVAIMSMRELADRRIVVFLLFSFSLFQMYPVRERKKSKWHRKRHPFVFRSKVMNTFSET